MTLGVGSPVFCTINPKKHYNPIGLLFGLRILLMRETASSKNTKLATPRYRSIPLLDIPFVAGGAGPAPTRKEAM